MPLPQTGMPKAQIIEVLEAYRGGDARWQDGRTFGMVYDAGAEAHGVMEAVATMFLHDNALNTNAFPSLAKIQSQVVGITAELLHGPDASGFMTSGGTESILCAVKAARERGREERGITAPELVLPVMDALRFIPDGATILDAKERVIAANDAFRRLYELPRGTPVVVTGSNLTAFGASPAVPYASAPVTSCHSPSTSACTVHDRGTATPSPASGPARSLQKCAVTPSSRTGSVHV